MLVERTRSATRTRCGSFFSFLTFKTYATFCSYHYFFQMLHWKRNVYDKVNVVLNTMT